MSQCTRRGAYEERSYRVSHGRYHIWKRPLSSGFRPKRRWRTSKTQCSWRGDEANLARSADEQGRIRLDISTFSARPSATSFSCPFFSACFEASFFSFAGEVRSGSLCCERSEIIPRVARPSVPRSCCDPCDKARPIAARLSTRSIALLSGVWRKVRETAR
jgi:hypothetical protein